jgi:hypothetical protein
MSASPQDMYSALVGGAPTDQQSQMALAQALRRQSQLGQLGQLSGDRVLAPAGENMVADAQKGATSISNERARQAAQAQALTFHNDQQQHEADALAQQMKIANMTDSRSRDEANATNALRQSLLTQKDQDAADRAAAAQAAKAEAAEHGGKPIPDGEFQKLSAYKDAAESVDQSLSTFKPEYAGAGKVIPRTATNWLASNMPSTAGALGAVNPTDQAANNWYQNYGRGFTMDEMHNKFGARLTNNEQQIFEQYHINPNMDAPTIVTNLTQIGAKAREKLNERLDALEAAGYNKDQIATIRSSVAPVTGVPGAAPTPGGAPGAATPAAAAPSVADKYRTAAKTALTMPAAPVSAPTSSLPMATGGQPPINTGGMRLPTIPGLQTGNLYSGFNP